MTIEAGQQLLQYRLIEKIGEGGMGSEDSDIVLIELGDPARKVRRVQQDE